MEEISKSINKLSEIQSAASMHANQQPTASSVDVSNECVAEISTLKDLCHRLERRCEILESEVVLLKSEIERTARRDTLKTIQNTVARSQTPVELTNNVDVNSVNNAETISAKPTIGLISAAPKVQKSSIFVSNLSTEVSADKLLEYLKKTFGESHIFKLEQQKVNSGEYNSFKIDVDPTIANLLLDSSNWPDKIVIKKFNFFRKPFRQYPSGPRGNQQYRNRRQ